MTRIGGIAEDLILDTRFVLNSGGSSGKAGLV